MLPPKLPGPNRSAPAVARQQRRVHVSAVRLDAATPVRAWRSRECWGPIAIAGVGVALLDVLVPVVVLQSRRLEQRMDAVADALAATRTELRAAVAELRAELAEVRRDLHARRSAWHARRGCADRP